MADKHSAQVSPPIKFCSYRVEKCEPHGNTYQEYDKPAPPWPKYPQAAREYDQDEKKKREEREAADKAKATPEFPAKVKMTIAGEKKAIDREKKWGQHVRKVNTDWKKHEAHHCVCCASVARFIADTVIKPVIDQTDWCVNQEANMVALPMWGHTFLWYCTPTGEVRDLSRVEDKLGVPRFKDRVMHNCDHDLYQEDEIEPALKDIADTVQANKEGHEECARQLADELNS